LFDTLGLLATAPNRLFPLDSHEPSPKGKVAMSEVPKIDTDSVSSRYQHKRKPGISWNLIAGMTVILLVFGAIFATMFLTSNSVSLRYNLQQKLVKQWILDNEGDPKSVQVEFIEGPKYYGGSAYMRIKYRSTNAFGALSLHQTAFIIDGDSVRSSQVGSHVYHRWESLPDNRFDSMKSDVVISALALIKNHYSDNLPRLQYGPPQWSGKNQSVSELSDRWVVKGTVNADQKPVNVTVEMMKTPEGNPGYFDSQVHIHQD